MTQEQKTKTNASYIAFRSFQTGLDTLGLGVPARVDPSVFPSFSGAAKSQMMVALRFLGLIGEQGQVSDDLRRLALDKDNRPVLLRPVIERAYPELVRLASENGTPAQFEAAMRPLAGAGETLKKAITFFIQAAEFCSITLPTSWTRGTRAAVGQAAVRRRRPRRAAPNDIGAAPVVHERPAVTPAQTGTTSSLTLASGGVVTLSLSVDLMALTVEDRKWLFDVIDKFAEYRNLHAVTEEDEEDEGDEE